MNATVPPEARFMALLLDSKSEIACISVNKRYNGRILPSATTTTTTGGSTTCGAAGIALGCGSEDDYVSTHVSGLTDGQQHPSVEQRYDGNSLFIVGQ